MNDEYSLTETLTNKIFRWKPVYRKIIPISATSIDANYDVSSLNIELLVSITNLMIRDSDWTYFSEWYNGSTTSELQAHLYLWTNNLSIRISDGTSYSWDIVLEYTKNP